MQGFRNISVCDSTIRFSDERAGEKLSFRLKIEVAKVLDRIGVQAIELNAIQDGRTDYLLVKSVASAVSEATVVVPVDIMDPESPSLTWEALKEAVHPRLQVCVPVSTVQMEYFCHRKPSAIIDLVSSIVKSCKALCPEVEFVACDFTRSEADFLRKTIEAAADSGAGIITLADASGDLLPDEFGKAVSSVAAVLPEGVKLGVRCSNEFHLADTCAVSAVVAGASEVKTTVFGRQSTSLERFSRILAAKESTLGISSKVDVTALRHAVERIRQMCESYRSKSRLSNGLGDSAKYEEMHLTGQDDMAAVLAAVRRLGYDLSEEDGTKVYDAFVQLAATNGSIEAKELDAIVATAAFQVPPTYRLESFVINSGTVIGSTCHIRLKRGGELLENACIGDGPIDAAFMAIENVIGRHYELDDFQIKSITEGREAMGDAVVRLRWCGKVYSGRGVSTDIIGSSIMAYLNAVNKIAYEEVQA